VEEIKKQNGSGIELLTPNSNIIAAKYVNSSDTDVFIFVNTSNQTSIAAEIDVTGKEFQLWDPYDGSVSGISATVNGNKSKIMLSIPKNKTIFVTVKR
jgi:hypothetical protein